MNIKVKKCFKIIALTAFLLVFIFTLSITALNDGLSKQLRSYSEDKINNYIENLSSKTALRTLSTIDRTVLHFSALASISVSYIPYPEASKLLFHYIYGDGSELRLSHEYFATSPYLASIIAKHGSGHHGPLALSQQQDWRLSLVFNPYYLDVTENNVRLYHPHIQFAQTEDSSVYTYVPIGLMKIKMYDNLVSALNPTPFYVYAEWSTQSD